MTDDVVRVKLRVFLAGDATGAMLHRIPVLNFNFLPGDAAASSSSLSASSSSAPLLSCPCSPCPPLNATLAVPEVLPRLPDFCSSAVRWRHGETQSTVTGLGGAGWGVHGAG